MGDDRPPVHRLGKRELGRHAFEQRMPDRVARLIAAEDDTNSRSDVISRLLHLLQADCDIAAAFLCTATAVQVHKIVGEGHHFCGYRNIQMLWLALRDSPQHSSAAAAAAAAAIATRLLSGKPSIPEIQHMIEQAWKRGFNAHGSVQTGGISGTRKDIGTSEAEALLLSHGISCTGTAFQGPNACAELFDFMQHYFTSSSPPTSAEKKPSVHATSRLPIFLQLPGHSVTVVGFELTAAGKRRLITFDPAYQPPSEVTASATPVAPSSGGYASWKARSALWRYRKTENAMRRCRGFETLTVDDISSS